MHKHDKLEYWCQTDWPWRFSHSPQSMAISMSTCRCMDLRSEVLRCHASWSRKTCVSHVTLHKNCSLSLPHIYLYCKCCISSSRGHGRTRVKNPPVWRQTPTMVCAWHYSGQCIGQSFYLLWLLGSCGMLWSCWGMMWSRWGWRDRLRCCVQD